MRRTLGLVLIILLTVGILAGCGLDNKAEQKQAVAGKEVHNPTKIRLGYQPSMPQAAFIIAKEKGWFEEEFAKDGTTIEYEKFIIGPPLIEAIAGERVDVGLVGDQPAIQAKANNIELKIIGVYSTTEKGAGLVVPNGSTILSAKDLKGKKVAVSVGSIFHQILLRYLKGSGLKAEDIMLVNMNPPDIKAALASKDIDAAVLGEPWISTVEYENIGKQIADTTGIKVAVSNIVAATAFVKEYPDAVKRVLKVYDRAEKWLATNPEEGIKLIVKSTGVKPEIVAKALPKSSYDVRLTVERVNSIADTAQFLRENNTIRKDVDVKELIDNNYLKAIGLAD